MGKPERERNYWQDLGVDCRIILKLISKKLDEMYWIYLGGHVACTKERRGEANTGFWWGKPKGKIQLGRPRRKWEDNIKTDLKEMG